MSSLSSSVRSHIAADHAAIEQTPIVRAMLDGSITRERYADLLAHLLPVHRVCDASITRVTLTGLASVCQRGDAARADLAALGPARVHRPSIPAQALAQRLVTLSEHHLLGTGYVVAGSRLGSRVLEPLLRAALDLHAGVGLSYHQGPADYPLRWRVLMESLDRLVLTAEQRQEVLAGASLTMRGLRDIYQEA